MRDQLKSLSHHWRDGAIPRGSARGRKVAKQQISVTINSRARDEVLFSHKSRKCIFLFFGPRSFQFSVFLAILKKKLLWNACAGHIPLHSENLPRATKNVLAGQYLGHPWFRRMKRLRKLIWWPVQWTGVSVESRWKSVAIWCSGPWRSSTTIRPNSTTRPTFSGVMMMSLEMLNVLFISIRSHEIQIKTKVFGQTFGESLKPKFFYFNFKNSIGWFINSEPEIWVVLN